MKLLVSLIVYLALSAGAIGATEDIAALRQGDMKKLSLHSAPKPVSEQGFEDENGKPKTLGDFKGRYALVNFWATWCAPCRKEMPSLSALQRDLGGDNFVVITIAAGRNEPSAIKKFMADNGIDNLPLYRDPKLQLSRDMGVLGLPVTVILAPDGQEIGRLQGDADWNSDSAKAVLSALITQK